MVLETLDRRLSVSPKDKMNPRGLAAEILVTEL